MTVNILVRIVYDYFCFYMIDSQEQDYSLSSVQLLSRVRLFVTPQTAARQATLSIASSMGLLKLISTESVMPSNHLIFCCPLSSCLQSFIRVFSNESVLCIRWPKYWCFSFSISPSNEYSGLISFRIDWLDLLAIQGTLKSLLQCHSSKASILWRSPFFTVQLSHPYMTTGKTTALTRWTFVGRVMSLLFNMLSRLVITFLSRSKRLLISWLGPAYISQDLQAPSYVVGTNYRVLIYCICHFQGSSLGFSFCLLVFSVSGFCPDTKGTVVDTFFFFFRLTCSVALWGGRDAANK